MQDSAPISNIHKGVPTVTLSDSPLHVPTPTHEHIQVPTPSTQEAEIHVIPDDKHIIVQSIIHDEHDIITINDNLIGINAQLSHNMFSPNTTLISDGPHTILDTPFIATAAQEKLLGFTFTNNPFGISVTHHISTRGAHPTLGLHLYIDLDTRRLLFKCDTATIPSA